MPDVAPSTCNIISLCAGSGLFDVAVRSIVRRARTVLYVERDIPSVALLEARIRDGALDDGPVWSDLKTLDSGPWRGLVDGVIGGIPCQPHSSAGKRLGAADPRDLWPAAFGVIRTTRPRFVFIENVGGSLREFHRRWRRDLEGAGYRVTEILTSAADVGAPHERERLFILAVVDTEHTPGRAEHALASDDEPAEPGTADGGVQLVEHADVAPVDVTPTGGRRRSRATAAPGSGARDVEPLADSGDGLVSQPRRRTKGRARPGPAGEGRGDADVRDADSARRTQAGAGDGLDTARKPQARDGGAPLADRAGDGPAAGGLHERQGRPGTTPADHQRRRSSRHMDDAAGGGLAPRSGLDDERARSGDTEPRVPGEAPVADRGRERPQGERAAGSAEAAIRRGSRARVGWWFWPPGNPFDKRGVVVDQRALRQWRFITYRRPDLAPATQPAVRRVDDGLAGGVVEPGADLTRAMKIHILGNGVVPQVAAAALALMCEELEVEL